MVIILVIPRELTKNAEEEKRKRLAPLAIPKQTVKEPSYTIPTSNKKTNPWGTPAKPVTSTLASSFPALPSSKPSSTADRFPQLPTKKPSTIRGKPVVIGATKQSSSTSFSTSRSAGHSNAKAMSNPTLDFGHVLQHDTPHNVVEPSPTEDVSPQAALPLTARFYTPPLARKSTAKTMVMTADLTWGVHEDPVEKAIEKAKQESMERGQGKGKGKKGNRGIRLF